MKTLATLLISLLLAAWIGAIALLSVQNFAPITLQFLGFQSIAMPIGLVLAFSVGLGIVVTAIVQPLLGFPSAADDFEDDR